MELYGEIVSGRPLLVLAAPEEAQFLDTALPVLVTGIGKVNAAAALALTLERGPAPSRIVNLGTAGALRPGLAGMHMVHTVIQHDLDTDLLLKLTSITYGTPITLADSTNGVVLASGDAFVADASARDTLATRADLVDMEGYALAAVAGSAGAYISLVKHVTDKADEHAVKSWRDGIAVSARELADWAATNVPGY